MEGAKNVIVSETEDEATHRKIHAWFNSDGNIFISRVVTIGDYIDARTIGLTTDEARALVKVLSEELGDV